MLELNMQIKKTIFEYLFFLVQRSNKQLGRFESNQQENNYHNRYNLKSKKNNL